MIRIDRVWTLVFLASLLGVALVVEPSAAQTTIKYPDLPSETPAKFEPATESFDYIKREVMIPMRDGVKLHTVIVSPKRVKSGPMLLTRTPYNATEFTSN